MRTKDTFFVFPKPRIPKIMTKDPLIFISAGRSKMPATVYLVTGGARSGKSRHAELICEQLSKTPIYLATASSPLLRHEKDADFLQRIKRHQHDRQNRNHDCSWTTIEEPLRPSVHADKFSGQVVLVDCMTLWLTNWLLEEGAFSMDTASKGSDIESEKRTTAAADRAVKKLQEEFEVMISPYNTTFVIVTNEVGSGTHAETHLSRKFVDAQGWCNQFVATKAQQVIHMVCGVAHILKHELVHYSVDGIIDNATAKRCEAQRLDRHLSTRRIEMDSKGYFLVKTNPQESVIVVSFHSCMVNDDGEVCDLEGNRIPCDGQSPEPMKVWKCKTAKEATTEVFERWAESQHLALSVGHAAYIGRETQKAEFSLYCAGVVEFQQD